MILEPFRARSWKGNQSVSGVRQEAWKFTEEFLKELEHLNEHILIKDRPSS